LVDNKGYLALELLAFVVLLVEVLVVADSLAEVDEPEFLPFPFA